MKRSFSSGDTSTDTQLPAGDDDDDEEEEEEEKEDEAELLPCSWEVLSRRATATEPAPVPWMTPKAFSFSADDSDKDDE